MLESALADTRLPRPRLGRDIPLLITDLRERAKTISAIEALGPSPPVSAVLDVICRAALSPAARDFLRELGSRRLAITLFHAVRWSGGGS